MADPNVYHIKFPGDITLEVLLQNPHPLDLSVKFSDGTGVHFTYDPDHGNKGKADLIGTKPEKISGTFDTRVRPGSLGTAGATGSPRTDVAIQYNDPGGSRM